MQNVKRQEGVVLIVALFIMALIATMSYVMMARLERDTYRTRLILNSAKSEYVAQGSIAWAIDQLRNNQEQKQKNRLVDQLPMQSPELNVDGYLVSSTISDLQSRVNLNNLNKAEAQHAFVNLILAVQPEYGTEKAQQLTRAIADWIAPASSDNTFKQYYLAQTPAYRAAHRAMINRSELKLVKGMTPALYQALEPYIIALPAGTLINVQTAPAAVLVTLSPTMTLAVAKSLEQLRQQTPFLSLEAFNKLDLVVNQHIAGQGITVESQYFLVETTVNIEKQHTVIYTLLERSSNPGKEGAVINIIGQSKGVW